MTMIDDFISLFFPRYCLGCSGSLARDEQQVCIHCLTSVPKTKSHEEETNFVAQKFYGKVDFQHALAYYTFQQDGIVQKLLHQIKYSNQPQLAFELGERYAIELSKKFDAIPFDLIIPVPLHFKKRKIRGYNQSEMFADGLASRWNIPVKGKALERKIFTTTQTSKTRIERWKNVESIFTIKDDSVLDQHILLVDDVITTGATIEACANSLIEKGAKTLSVAAIAAAK